MVNDKNQNSINNPKQFLTEFYEKMASYSGGPEAFLKARETKRDREYWAISMFLIGLNKITGTLWWIKDSKEDPPDGVAVNYKITNDSTIKEDENVSIEVVFVPKYVKHQNWGSKLSWDSKLSNEENIYNFLYAKKFKNKSYESGTCLIIYFDIILDGFSLEKLSKLISKRNSNLTEIWHIISIDSLSEQFLIGKIYPDRNETILKLDECLLKDFNTIIRHYT